MRGSAAIHLIGVVVCLVVMNPCATFAWNSGKEDPQLVGPGQAPGPQGASGADTTTADAFSSPNVLPAVPLSAPASYSGDRDTERRLNSYLLRHNQLAGSAGRQGFVSFVPIIAKTAAEPEGSEAAGQGPQVGSQADPESNAKP